MRRDTLAFEMAWPSSSLDRARERVERRRLRRLLDDGSDDVALELTAQPLGLGMLRE